MSSITLYAFALSPFALKVRCYLLFLGVDFDTVYVNPLAMRDPDDLRKVKDPERMKAVIPCGKTIPALQIGKDCINESSDAGQWLADLYTDTALIPDDIASEVRNADHWVSTKLINLAFRDAIGFDNGLVRGAIKRWRLSRVLRQTSPDNISFAFRVMHLLSIGRSFIKSHIDATDTSRSLLDLKLEMAREFEERLAGGPFLCGASQPTMADLSAYPQIVKPKLIDGEDYLLPGLAVSQWVQQMEQAVPELDNCFPETIRL